MSLRRVRRSPAVEILEIDNGAARAAISLFGGHVLAFMPHHDGRERLWLSERAIWDGTASIRGGVPVCWPWFGDHAEPGHPAHGYVRTRPWRLLDSREGEDFTELSLAPLDTLGDGFAGRASLRLDVRVGHELTMSLRTGNEGSEPFTYRCALHSYFRVGDIEDVELRGLHGEYSDKALNWARGDTPAPYRFAAETDRIHLVPMAEAVIADARRRTVVRSHGHDSLVVWNPWEARAAALRDMESGGWRRMLCVETAITQGHTLEPGREHVLQQVIA